MRLGTDCGWSRMSYCRVWNSLYKQYSLTVKYKEKFNDQMHVLKKKTGRGSVESEWENILGRLRILGNITVVYI